MNDVIAMRRIALIAVISVTLVAGCQDKTKGIVTGSVTMDGNPVASGSIAFIPIDKQSPTAGGAITDGKYTATVPIGSAKVEIRVPKVMGQKKLYDTPDSPMKPILAEALPPRYNEATELTLDVKPGENQQDYQLTTK